MKDIELMVGFRLYMHWWVVWVIVVPVLLTVSLSPCATMSMQVYTFVNPKLSIDCRNFNCSNHH